MQIAPPLAAPTHAPPGVVLPPGEARQAGRWLWGTLAFFLGSFVVGAAWDRAWHATNPFEGFFSPPHIFVYATAGVSALLVARLAWSPRLRVWYGPVVRHRLLFGTASGAAAIAGIGLMMLGFAGLVLDNAWHTRFGLNETLWSAPHAMIGWSIWVTILGFVAARLGLRAARPLGPGAAVVLGWLVLGGSVVPFLGPFRENMTPEQFAARSAWLRQFPALFATPDFAHTLRIEAAANLTRTHPASVLLGAVWVGLALALVRGLHRSPWVMLAAVALSSALQLLGDRGDAQRLAAFGLTNWRDGAQWLPLPVLPAAIALLLLERTRLYPAARWAIVGFVYALCAAFVWGREPLWIAAVALAPLTCAGGGWLGGRVLRLLEQPTAGGVLRFAPLLCVVGPILSGAVDLWLRSLIP